MAYHRISTMDIWDIIRRWHDRHTIRQIATATGCDRKTVRSHIRLALSLGLSLDAPLPPREEVVVLLAQQTGPLGGRTPKAQNRLLPYRDEIAGLINDPHLPVKPKTAFEIIVARHDLAGKVSYPSFKRFVHAHKFVLSAQRTSCRLEVPPGSEVQVDYAKIGLFADPTLVGRRRTVYAFIGTLAHSRMKYVELTFRQDQTSFVCSHARMFTFFGGVPLRIVPDNLKAGIITPDLYDPVFNRTYREMSEHYGCFIDPARVRHPKDKGKVERDVQTVRQQARHLLHLHGQASLAELNRLLLDWCCHQYGQRKHGTTGELPFTVWQEREQPALKQLPPTPYEPVAWKEATVHPDHYVQFRNKVYSVPHAYVGKKVWIRATERVLQVFHDERLIKQHVITKGYRHTDFADFPDNVRAALDHSATHTRLLERAQSIGPYFHRLIRELLEPHAFLYLRSALGLVEIAEHAPQPSTLVERAAQLMTEQHIKATPQNLRAVLAKVQVELTTPLLLPLSDATRAFVRESSYFLNTNTERPL